ncbi:uncharacterized protein LOC119450181 [Dermacentor silvarum]|uniref:uncharacterized protein LOC119450181 n=1 Tax=Dermacentor silvarum TaxID=543639 RepID=UPI002101822A|nr:uncharacterized protein LOC119450181 [Dermacentor silvarum]
MATDRDEVETILSSILASEKDGLTLRRLDDEYRATVGTCIPFEEFGHDTLAEFLESMPEVVSLQRGFNKDIIAHAAYNAVTAHVTKMVAEQKSGPVRVHKQHVQRPCHRNVHPYRKQLWASKNSSARDTYNFQPLMELPGNVEQFRSSQYSNRPGANRKRRSMKFPMAGNFVYGNGRGSSSSSERNVAADDLQTQRTKGWCTANMMAWMSFLKAAGIVRKMAVAYSRLLMLHGVNPSSMWLCTGQDIFQMGISNFRDIHLIQEHAHQLHALHRSSVIALWVPCVMAAGTKRCQPWRPRFMQRAKHYTQVFDVDNWLEGAGYPGTFNEGSAGQDGSLVHVPLRRNRRSDRAKGHYNYSVTLENECWLEDDRLHLSPPLRRTRMLKLKHGFVPTALNFQSVVSESSIKRRLGWRH